MASRVGVMYLGRIVEIAEGRELFARPRMPYTKMLLGAVPDLAMSGTSAHSGQGRDPEPDQSARRAAPSIRAARWPSISAARRPRN